MERSKYQQLDESSLTPEQLVNKMIAKKSAKDIESEFSRTKEFEYSTSQHTERIPRLVSNFRDAIEFYHSLSIEKKELTPRVSFLVDGDVISHQEVDVFPLENGGYKVAFKIDLQKWEVLRNDITHAENYDPNISVMVTFGDFIQFRADKIVVEDLDVFVATGKAAGAYENIDSIGARGLIEIDIPKEFDNKTMSMEEVTQKIDSIFKNYLKIPEGIATPSIEQEHAYECSLYMWHHKKFDGHITKEEWDVIEKCLKRTEVFPGYQEVIDEGKHLEYEKYGKLLLFHQLTGGGPIADILRYGLMSTEERSKRGISRHGISPSIDFHSGSGDRVFTTMYSEDVPNVENVEKLFGRGQVPGTRLAILDNTLLDRVDWYAFLNDEYGTRAEPYFTENRVSPEKFIKAIRTEYHGNNEVAFRRGVPAYAIKHILVGTMKEREDTITELHSEGIPKVNGRAIEDIVLIKDDFLDTYKSKN